MPYPTRLRLFLSSRYSAAATVDKDENQYVIGKSESFRMFYLTRRIIFLFLIKSLHGAKAEKISRTKTSPISSSEPNRAVSIDPLPGFSVFARLIWTINIDVSGHLATIPSLLFPFPFHTIVPMIS